MIKAFAFSSPYGNGGVFAPSSGKSASDRRFRYSDFFRPVGYVHRSSVGFNEPHASSIAALCFPVCPNTVAGFVSNITFDSFNRKPGWAFPHVSKEVGKAVAPSFANAYSPASIVGIPGRACGIASGYDAFPYLVRLCSGLSVRNPHRFDVFSVNAPARMRFSSKVATGHDLSVSAVTNAVPEYLAVDVFACKGFNQKPMEFLTSKVLAFAHFVTSKLLTVNGAWQSAVRQIFGSYPSQAGVILA